MNLNLLPGIDSSAAALNAERIRLEIVSQNIANANTTRGLDGRPYQRQMVVFENALQQAQSANSTQPGKQCVRVSRIEKDTRPARLIHNPGHPDANADGMVAMPNINIYEEMADLIASSRAFEANLAVVKNSRQMALQALAIGRR